MPNDQHNNDERNTAFKKFMTTKSQFRNTQIPSLRQLK